MADAPDNGDNRMHLPDNRGTRRHMADWRPSRRMLLLAALAFAVGLLLFVLVWWHARSNDFYRPEGVPQTAEGQQFEPLPAPLPAESADQNASGIGQRNTEQPSSLPPAPAVPEPMPSVPPPPRPPAAPVAQAPTSAPTPISSPAPTYPTDAFRNGESGTVVLRVHVGADGAPVAVDLVQSSRSRSLDRAASDAVKRWRFRPALHDGEPVAGDIEVPIHFAADR
jgi:protein TonB